MVLELRDVGGVDRLSPAEVLPPFSDAFFQDSFARHRFTPSRGRFRPLVTPAPWPCARCRASPDRPPATADADDQAAPYPHRSGGSTFAACPLPTGPRPP